MKILYFSSSGAIPSTFLLGQRIIQWLDTSKIAYEKVDVFLNRKARDDLESLHGKVQIPCLVWEERLIFRKQIEQALENDGLYALLFGEAMTDTSAQRSQARKEKVDAGVVARIVQTNSSSCFNPSSHSTEISLNSQQEKLLNGIRRRLYVAKYLLEDASQHIKTTMVSIKYPNHSTYLTRYIQLKEHLLCIFETQDTIHSRPAEMIVILNFFLKRQKSTVIKVTANHCSFDIAFQNKETCNAWWNVLLRTKRFLQLEAEEIKMKNQLNEKFEMLSNNADKDQAARRIQAIWRAYQSRKLVAQIRRSLQDMELGQQENIDSILEGLEMIGSAKIGTEARVRGWIQWDREMIQVQWYRKLPLSTDDSIEPIPGAVCHRRVVTADDIGQQLLAKVSWKQSQNSRQTKAVFLELASPVILSEHMRAQLEQNILQEFGQYWVNIRLVENTNNNVVDSNGRLSQQRHCLFKVTSEKIFILSKSLFARTLGKFLLSQLDWVRIDQESKSMNDETAKCFLIAFKNDRAFQIFTKTNAEREELVMTIRAFRAIHIIGSRLHSFSCELPSKKLQLFKFHGMKKLFEKSEHNRNVETIEGYSPKEQIENGTPTNFVEHATVSHESVQSAAMANEEENPENSRINMDENNEGILSSDPTVANTTVPFIKPQKPAPCINDSYISSFAKKQCTVVHDTTSVHATTKNLEEKSLESEMSNVQSMESVTTRRVHWHKVPMNRLKGSIWQEVQSAIAWKVDESEVKAIFQLHAEPVSCAAPNNSTDLDAPKISLIDEKYARNLEILMGRFRNITSDKVKNFILNGECSSATKMDEFLPLLAGLIPSTDDQQQLLEKAKSLDIATLSPPEKFLITLCQVPRCHQKVQSILFKLTFQETSGKVLRDLEMLIQGAKEICQSDALKEIASLSLSIGNVLNAQHPQGNAKGYSIEDINGFHTIRSSKFSRVTLLNYMVSILKKKGSQAVLLSEQLASLRACASLDSDNVLAQFEGLEHDMQQLYEEICASLEDASSMPFGQVMKPWYEDEAQKTMDHLRTMIHQWHEHMEDVILYLPSVDATSCYHSIFQHLSQFVTDFYRAWDEADHLKILGKTGIKFERLEIQEQVSEILEAGNIYDDVESQLPPPPPPPPPPFPPLAASSHFASSMPSLSVMTSVN